MPYIDQDARERLRWGSDPTVPGDLNYCITKMIWSYLNCERNTPINYAHLNEVIGVLECVKQELYRRIAAPYEDTKMEENGDVYQT